MFLLDKFKLNLKRLKKKYTGINVSKCDIIKYVWFEIKCIITNVCVSYFQDLNLEYWNPMEQVNNQNK